MATLEDLMNSSLPIQNIPTQQSDSAILVNNPYDKISNSNDKESSNEELKPLGSVDSNTYNNNNKGTLDEAVTETLKRDVFRIGKKLYSVLNPFSNIKDRPKLILQWDLWGPLIFTILLSCTLSINNNEKGEIFVLVFFIFWFGSFLIYLNGNLLGSKLGMFHIMCLIGYCMVPLNFSSILFALGHFHIIFRVIIVIFCCVWSSYSSIGFVKDCIQEEQKLLVIYPIILEYLFLSGVIIIK